MASPPNPQLDALLPAALLRAYQQLSLNPNPSAYPHYTNAQGIWLTTDAGFWTSGFWPGELWLANELSGASSWVAKAQTWTNGVQSQQSDTTSHDIGYKIFPPYLNGYRLTGNANYRSVILAAAGSMATRYGSTVGCIKSFEPPSSHAGQFPVEIDNVPTLEMLLWAARNGGQSSWRDMAISHALRTRTEFLHSSNNGTYHVVWFNPGSGAVISRGTMQGYSDTSTWTRGQAWGIYGFVMCYRETGDSRFLATAQSLADYYLGRLPADLVPPWDFDAPQTNPPKDSSAAATVAAALLDLSRLVPDSTTSQRYWDAACSMLISLCSSTYLSDGTNSQGILLHGTGHWPAGTAVDVSLIWGDYYFLQAIDRYRYLSRTTTGSHTSTATWQNWLSPIRRGQFRVEYDAIPGAGSIDGITALSAGPGSAYPHFGVLVRFNTSGTIDVRNGANYQAETSFHYTAGTSYHFCLDVDVANRTYSVYVTSSGGSQVRLASNYAFRTEQSGATYLDNLGLICETGSLTLSNCQVDGYRVHNLTQDKWYITVQEAIDAAVDGDEIILNSGTYYENLLIRGRQIILRSTNPDDPSVVAATILDGQQLDSVVAFSGTEGPQTVLKGLTITRGEVDTRGGGISGNGCTATIADCVVTANTAGYLGGPQGAGGGIAECNGLILDCTISGNTASGYEGKGGGLAYCLGDIVNCTITNNSAASSEGDGGGLYRCGGTIHGCTISGNQTGWWGGGISWSDADITDCVIAGNTSGGGGAGLSHCGGTIKSCLVVGNINTGAQGENGGGLFQCNGSIVGCTVVRNEARRVLGDPFGGAGGGLNGCSGLVRNCVIRLNVSQTGGGQIASCSTPTYSCIEGWTGGGTGNINSDPKFMDEDGPDNNPATWADNDYRLSHGSLCTNTGDPTYAPVSGETDLDGRPRLLYGRVDMGAYEFLLPGDANLDGYVNVGDLQALVAAWASQKTPPSSNWDPNCDFNNDGFVNVGDLQVLVANWARSL